MRCRKIEYIDEISDLYDLEIDGGDNNYLADGIVVHNTFCAFGILPEKDEADTHVQRKYVVFSKGLGARGLCFEDNERNRGNIYFRALERAGVFEKFKGPTNSAVPIFILGEAFGVGVQDLSYGGQVDFRVFDVCFGYRGSQQYLSYEDKVLFCSHHSLKMVPTLYRGPFSRDLMLQYTVGSETISGNAVHIREGIVITPVVERVDPAIGRVFLKSVSDDYLFRKNATEFN